MRCGAFVGIDSSVPDSPARTPSCPSGSSVREEPGLVRLIASFRGTGYDESVYSADVQEQIALLTNRNTLSPTYLNAMSLLHTNFEDALGTSFPEDLPLLLFVVSDNPTVPTWVDLHEEQAAAVDDGTVVPLDGTHYLHHTHTRRSSTSSARGAHQDARRGVTPELWTSRNVNGWTEQSHDGSWRSRSARSASATSSAPAGSGWWCRIGRLA